MRIIRKAKVNAWPKLFQNLRTSRVTELHDHFPGHVVDTWCGHSEAVSKAHYRQTLEEHFDRAAVKTTKVCSGESWDKNDGFVPHARENRTAANTQASRKRRDGRTTGASNAQRS